MTYNVNKGSYGNPRGSGGSSGNVGNVEGSGEPTNVTPAFAGSSGQVYKRTTTGDIWRAQSLTQGDWALEVQNAQFMWEPQTVNLFALAELVISGPIPTVTSFTVNIPVHGGGITIGNTPSTLATISFPATTAIDPDSNNTGTLKIYNHAALTTLNLPLLSICGWQLIITSNPALTTLSLPSFVSCDGGLEISGSGVVNLSVPLWIPKNGRSHVFVGNALNAASVNGLLARGVANAGFVSGSLLIDQGTNAAPTGQGIADAATLIGRGVTVTTN